MTGPFNGSGLGGAIPTSRDDELRDKTIAALLEAQKNTLAAQSALRQHIDNLHDGYTNVIEALIARVERLEGSAK